MAQRQSRWLWEQYCWELRWRLCSQGSVLVRVSSTLGGSSGSVSSTKIYGSASAASLSSSVNSTEASPLSSLLEVTGDLSSQSLEPALEEGGE